MNIASIDIYPDMFDNIELLIQCIFLKLDYLKRYSMKKYKKNINDILYMDELNNFYVKYGERYFYINYYTFPCGVKQIKLYNILYIPQNVKIIKRKLD